MDYTDEAAALAKQQEKRERRHDCSSNQSILHGGTLQRWHEKELIISEHVNESGRKTVQKRLLSVSTGPAAEF